MAYDEELAERIRDRLGAKPDISETKMFGGLAFLAGGHMAIAASGQGGALVRVDPVRTDELTAGTGAEVAVMRGRPMDGWLRVGAADLAAPDDLDRWAELGVSYARSLPPKKPKPGRRR